MRTSIASTIASALLVATAPTPVDAGDMTHERALNAGREPHNWLLHHGNYQGHRFSPLKEINADNAKNLKLAFTVALAGYEGGGSRYTSGSLEATPIVEDGIMYVPDGWGRVYAIDLGKGNKGTFRWRFDPQIDRPWAADVACPTQASRLPPVTQLAKLAPRPSELPARARSSSVGPAVSSGGWCSSR